jgi:hypothetical protein
MIQLENQWKDFYENWNGGCAIGDHPKIVLFKFLPSIIIKWGRRKVLRWDRQ